MGWFEFFTGSLSQEGFAQRVITDLRAAGDHRQATFEAADFRLAFHGDGQQIGCADLRNLYDEYVSAAVKDRDRFFRHAVRSLLAAHKPLPTDYEDARHDVLLTVRNRSYFSLPEIQDFITPGAQLLWPHQIVGEHLGVGLVYDLPEVMVMLQASHLDAWDLTFYEVYENALNNLHGIDAGFAAIDDHSYISTTEDHYDASRIVLSELIAELKVKGDPVVLLPNRDRLIITGTEDRQGLETSARVTQQLITQPRPVTGFAFRLLEHEWTPWLPDADHPAFRLLKSLAIGTRKEDYRQQRQLLDDWVAAGALDRCDPVEFCVHASGTRQPPFSYCVWQEGRTSLLPKTDRICLLRSGQLTNHPLVEGVNVSWDRAKRIVGPLLVEYDQFYPVRYRTQGFPLPDQLVALGR